MTSPRYHEAVLYLLQHMPACLHLVLITRLDPPFSLGTWRVRNQIAEISAADLSFTDKEAADFLLRTMSLDLTDEQIREFMAYAEGWVGGLQLIGLAMGGPERPRELKDTLKAACRVTADYLISEIVDVQQERVKDFLHTTVLLNRFNAEVCRAITGIEETQEILDYLLRINLFLIPLDAEHTWYRYHHLFSESVRPRILSDRPGVAAEVHHKAALWFAEHDYLEDAFQHAFAAEDDEFAALMLEDHLCKFFDRYANESVQRWLFKVPHGVFMKHPQLRLDECLFKVLSQEFEDVEAVIKDIEDNHQETFSKYEGFKKIRFQNTFAYLKHSLPYHRDPARADVGAMKGATTEITEDKRLFGLTLHSTMASCCLYQGKLAESEAILKESWPSVSSSESVFRKMLWYRTSADLERWRGRLGHSQTAVKQAVRLLERENLGDTSLKLYLYQPLAWVHYLRNELDKALEYATMSCRNAEQVSRVNEIIGARFLLSLLACARGEPDKALLHSERLESAASRSIPGSSKLAGAYLAQVSAMAGHLESAEKWVASLGPLTPEPFSIEFIYQCLARARLLHVQGRYADSCALLHPARKQCMERGMIYGAVQMDMLRAGGLHMSGHHKLAKAVLKEAVAFAERERYVAPFVECSTFLGPLLADAARDPLFRRDLPFLPAVLSACGLAAAQTTHESGVPTEHGPYFTGRELEVLRLVVAGYKKREIAVRLFISPHTVKTHARHIFDKLQAKTKAEAICRAREAGLIG